MNTSTLKSLTLTGMISTDEGFDSPVDFSFDYTETSDALGDYGVTITDIAYEVQFGTETPADIILDQVKDLIKAHYYGLTVDFEL